VLCLLCKTFVAVVFALIKAYVSVDNMPMHSLKYILLNIYKLYFQAAFGHFKALDERINFVATKVVHLGDQLEGVNTPRTRAAEAQMLMKYFSEFLEYDKPLSHVFTDPFQVPSHSLTTFLFQVVNCSSAFYPIQLKKKATPKSSLIADSFKFTHCSLYVGLAIIFR